MIRLEQEMIYRVRTSHPLEPTAGSPRAVIQYWQVSEAELEGQRIRAKLAATGMDWMRVDADGFWRPDVRAQFVTADGANRPRRADRSLQIVCRIQPAHGLGRSIHAAPRSPTSIASPPA